MPNCEPIDCIPPLLGNTGFGIDASLGAKRALELSQSPLLPRLKNRRELLRHFSQVHSLLPEMNIDAAASQINNGSISNDAQDGYGDENPLQHVSQDSVTPFVSSA